MAWKESVAIRVDRETKQLIEETKTCKSGLVRRAMRCYVRKNPDVVTALYPTNCLERFMAEVFD